MKSLKFSALAQNALNEREMNALAEVMYVVAHADLIQQWIMELQITQET